MLLCDYVGFTVQFLKHTIKYTAIVYMIQCFKKIGQYFKRTLKKRHVKLEQEQEQEDKTFDIEETALILRRNKLNEPDLNIDVYPIKQTRKRKRIHSLRRRALLQSYVKRLINDLHVQV